MTTLSAIGTYLPPWGTRPNIRSAGPDEDAVTMAVAAGQALFAAAPDAVGAVRRVVLVSRDLPLLEGGNAAALLGGLGLSEGLSVIEQIGGGPAVLDALVEASPGTLVLVSDSASPAGAGAALLSDEAGAELAPAGRRVGSLPVVARGRDGVVRSYEDPRLNWVRGATRALDALELTEKPLIVVGITAKQAATVGTSAVPSPPVSGASAAIFALAELSENGETGVVVAIEQASATAARLVSGGITIGRDEQVVRPLPELTETPGPDIAISLAAYERAFEAKLRWEAGSCGACGTLALPPRLRCLECGSEDGWSLTPLPRDGEVYTGVTIHVPVPGLPTPYSLVITQLDGVDARALVKVTGVAAGTTSIGDRGRLVFRRVALRSGIPDYGYAFLPDQVEPAAPLDQKEQAR